MELVIKSFAAAVLVTGAVVAQGSVLVPRDLDGNAANGAEAYFDPAANVTWMADWRKGAAGGFTWADAVQWAAGLRLGGVAGWRLPNVATPDCQAYNCRNGELGHLWYEVLGNVAPHLTNRGPFANMASDAYWTGTLASNAANAWSFNTTGGFQATSMLGERYSVVAVHDGDVPAVPEPAAALLTLGGLGVLACRRKRANH